MPPFQPYSLATSAQPYENLLLCRLQKQCWMVCIEFPRRNKGTKGTSSSTFETGPHRGWALERAYTTSQRNQFPSDLNRAGPALRMCCRTETELGYCPCSMCYGLLATTPGSQIAGKIKLGTGNPTLFKRDVRRVFQDKCIWGHCEHSILMACVRDNYGQL